MRAENGITMQKYFNRFGFEASQKIQVLHLGGHLVSNLDSRAAKSQYSSATIPKYLVLPFLYTGGIFKTRHIK